MWPLTLTVLPEKTKQEMNSASKKNDVSTVLSISSLPVVDRLRLRVLVAINPAVRTGSPSKSQSYET